MASEIRINLDPVLFEGDLTFDETIQDFESDMGLETAVIISLFTDRRANEDDVLPDLNNTDRRGWWGDLVSQIGNDQIGSKLWLLKREKTTPTTIIKAKKYVEEALQWMIDDGIAIKIEVETERQGVIGNDILAIKVRIYRDYKNKQAQEFSYQWEIQEARN
jgi:phage gp46-like protein